MANAYRCDHCGKFFDEPDDKRLLSLSRRWCYHSLINEPIMTDFENVDLCDACYESLTEWWDKWETTMGEWIPTTKRLPETQCFVLASVDLYNDPDNINVLELYRKDGKWTSDGFDSYPDESVLAWQPLPDPYRGADND